jgi:DNA-directed RNA polymerase specialized sigma24 family protein
VAFSRLPERYRDVLRLRYGLGWKSSEVAARLGYEPLGMRRVTSQSLVSLGRELESVGLSRRNLS